MAGSCAVSPAAWATAWRSSSIPCRPQHETDKPGWSNVAGGPVGSPVGVWAQRGAWPGHLPATDADDVEGFAPPAGRSVLINPCPEPSRLAAGDRISPPLTPHRIRSTIPGVSQRICKSYRVLVGMEIHVQLATQSKMFTSA